MTIAIRADYFPKGTNARPGKKLVPKFITIHNTGVIATARQGVSFFKRNSKNYCSAHFFVDDKEIIQMIPENEIAWHAGDGYLGRGNNESLSIEICEVEDQEAANKNAVKLVQFLLGKYPRIPVVPHIYWIKKDCPRLLLPSVKWERFLSKIYGGFKK